MSYSKSFDFLDRKNTDCAKWHIEGMKNMASYVDDESLPLWVADMDFQTVPCVLEILKKRIDHGCFGYSIPNETYYTAIQSWYHKHYQWDIQKEWIITTPGIVPSIAYLIQSFTKEGEGVIIQEPVYYPFRASIEKNNRKVLNNNLLEHHGMYAIDFDDLLKKASDPNTKLMILCSPHNPIGRLWTKEELQKVAEICYTNNVILCADEIHSDLILFDNTFISCGSLEDKLLQNIIVCTAPSKTFNLAAFATSNLIITNENIRTILTEFMDKLWIKTTPTMIGNILVPAVYSKEGEEWLTELLHILEDHYYFVDSYLKNNIPKIKLTPLQGTYLVWMDFRETKLSWEEIERKMEEEAKIVLDPGSKFGEAGRGFMRINIACHRSTLENALDRIKQTYSK
ncbi:MAG: MalY/PatB family protein [Brevinema sp.]